ncbi:SURF1 family protein [Rhizobium glycinendophyticum]|uniref:SURF1-like protein n=1 Tax=Rhizobium glycinendophyticum TaxID=2589807 RepID=A0A504UYD8_9HYPH|nr:SURF1 family protein [Rhizobium glycinendophyticum]TPP10202.1 SURF1 family protein [Rhizobium glycinendophyticum]
MVEQTDAVGKTSRGWRFWAGLVLVPLAIAILLSLGTWQVNRLHWKESLLTAIDERSHAPAIDVSEIAARLAAGEEIDYRHATASGRFLHDKERHFLATFDGQSGFYLYTPLELADGRFLFVNRGFVPYDRKDAQTRPESLVEGQQTVTGLARARLNEKPSSLVPDNNEATNIFYWKDLTRMAASTGLPEDRVLPFFLDADATPVPGGLPKGGVTQVDLPNSHLQYAITWYGLAFALAAVTIAGLFRRRTP